MSKEKDRVDFDNLIHRLESEGREFGKDDSDSLTDFLGGEKFPFATRMIVNEIVNLVWDNPEFGNMIPENLMKFFSGFIFPKSEGKMYKAKKIIGMLEDLNNIWGNTDDQPVSFKTAERMGIVDKVFDAWKESAHAEHPEYARADWEAGRVSLIVPMSVLKGDLQKPLK